MLEYDPEHPWVRQPCDTDLTWALFSEYLAQPLPRRLHALGRRVGFTIDQIEILAWEDAWKERATAWDRHLDALRDRTIEEVTQEDARQRALRQGRVGKKLQVLAEREIDKLAKIMSRDEMPGAITFREAIRAAQVGVHIERLALGESTERVETGPNLENLTLDELRSLREMQEKVGQNGH